MLISIQSLILVDEPYFNEPGFEQEQGTENGVTYQRFTIRIHGNYRYAMIDHLLKPDASPFAELIREHFGRRSLALRADQQMVEAASCGAQKSSGSYPYQVFAGGVQKSVSSLQSATDNSTLCWKRILERTTDAAAKREAGDSVVVLD